MKKKEKKKICKKEEKPESFQKKQQAVGLGGTKLFEDKFRRGIAGLD